MIASGFDYVVATTVDDAVGRLGDGAVVLAGGQSLLPELRRGWRRPSVVVDIGRIGGLDAIEVGDAELSVGALVTIDALSRADGVRGALADALAVFGDPQVRNRSTIGGGLANRTPGADLPAVLVALGATVDLAGTGGTKLAVEEAFGAEWQLAAGQLVLGVHVPTDTRSAYEKVANAGSGYAVCGVAVSVTTGADGSVSSCRVAAAGLGPGAVRLSAVESALQGTSAGADDIASAARTVRTAGLDAVSDVAATADYRIHLTEVLTARALARATE